MRTINGVEKSHAVKLTVMLAVFCAARIRTPIANTTPMMSPQKRPGADKHPFFGCRSGGWRGSGHGVRFQDSPVTHFAGGRGGPTHELAPYPAPLARRGTESG